MQWRMVEGPSVPLRNRTSITLHTSPRFIPPSLSQKQTCWQARGIYILPHSSLRYYRTQRILWQWCENFKMNWGCWSEENADGTYLHNCGDWDGTHLLRLSQFNLSTRNNLTREFIHFASSVCCIFPMFWSSALFVIFSSLVLETGRWNKDV